MISSRFKCVFLAILLTIPAFAKPGKTSLIGNACFGDSQQAVALALHEAFGKAGKQTENTISYSKELYRGMRFDRLTFTFQQDRLVDASFSTARRTRAEAIALMDSIAVNMKQTYGISKDKEDQGPWFYVGGISPRGIGHLFTIFIYRKQGLYYTELRFGPFAVHYFDDDYE